MLRSFIAYAAGTASAISFACFSIMAHFVFSLTVLTASTAPHTSPYILEDMTLEEKVGQVLITQFQGESANEDAKRLIQDMHIGGIIYYNWSNGLTSPEQVSNLSKGLQQLSSQTRLKIPLFIAADQEGGLVARLTQGFTVFPGNKALSMTYQPELARQAAVAMGEELRAVGVNFNLAPVVDVNTHSRNPVIGIRSFGATPESVIAFASQALKGYHEAGVITSIKHFPGHGDVEVDSHEALPYLNKSKQQLQAVELLPFRQLGHLADTVMTAHIMAPSIDPDYCATLSKSILDILRNEIGFQGVVITDSLVMEGVLKKTYSIDEAAIQALNAGCDILLLGGKQLIGQKHVELTVEDIARIHQNLVQAVRQGRIPKKRLDEAVTRILTLKDLYNLLLPAKSQEMLSQTINTSAHTQLAKQIAASALQVVKNRSFVKPLDQSRVIVMASETVRKNIDQTCLLSLGKENHSFFWNGLNPSKEDMQVAMERAKDADTLLVCVYNAWKTSAQVSLIQSLCQVNKSVCVLVLCDPVDATLFPQTALILKTFSPVAPSIQAACIALRKITSF